MSTQELAKGALLEDVHASAKPYSRALHTIRPIAVNEVISDQQTSAREFCRRMFAAWKGPQKLCIQTLWRCQSNVSPRKSHKS